MTTPNASHTKPLSPNSAALHLSPPAAVGPPGDIAYPVVGDRQANSALYIVTIVRMRHHEPTRAYVERRTNEGLNKREIIRCLKRYIAREIYANLPRPETNSAALTAAA